MIKQNYKRTVAIFDLDNTLIDSQAKLRADFIGAMTRLGIQMTPEEIKTAKWYETAQKYGFTREQFDEAFNQRKTWAQSLADGEAPLFSDTISCLEELISNGIRIGVLSRSIPEYTLTKLDYHNLTRYFETIETVHPKIKDKIEGAKSIIERMNPNTIKRIGFIGDQTEDVTISESVQNKYGLMAKGIYLNRNETTIPQEIKGYDIIRSLKEVPARLMGEYN